MQEYVVVLTTCPIKVSQELARFLAESRACACVNIIPKITSIYHWKNDLVIDDEALLIMKTERKQSENLWKVLKENHPYEVPEFVVIPIDWGSKDYLDWISQSVGKQ
ncbi:MAG: divalent-cation tolerance protein CutA [Candidatus Sifarchaeia archaeon]